MAFPVWHAAKSTPNALFGIPLVGGKPCPPDFFLVGATPGRDIVIHANPRFKKSKKRANIIDAFGVDSPRTALL
ncbi:hypothetical protein J4G08_18965 [Candidatus Poribacteria bacterium]|nr:hypothetical protein [Candidatus Poribacteria bacterium]